EIAGILGLLPALAAAGAWAAPAEEYILDMAIAVHPDAERATPAETAARTRAMLDEATSILEGVDADSSAETACPIRFRATNIRRAGDSEPPFRGGRGAPSEAALFRESVLGELTGCAAPPAQTLGMLVGPGFDNPPMNAGGTYAHEMGHLAGVPGNHAGW